MKQQKALTLKTLTKSNVWEVQENDILRMWETVEKDADFKDNRRHFVDVIRSAFEIEEIKIDKPVVIQKYEDRGFTIASLHITDNDSGKYGIKKRPIMRVTDLTYENIRHISAAKLIEVLDRNFGGGWDSLSQSIQDIIESGFDISTTTLPKDRLHKPGGMYEKKVNDGFEVLEITKGAWVEAIFAKEKPEVEKPVAKVDDDDFRDKYDREDDEEETKKRTCQTTSMATTMTTTIPSTRTSSRRKVIVQHSIQIQKTLTLRRRMLRMMTIIIKLGL